VQISAGFHHNVLLNSEGKAFANGCNAYGQCDIPEIKGHDARLGIRYVQVSAGSRFTALLRSDGQVVTTKGYRGNAVPGLSENQTNHDWFWLRPFLPPKVRFVQDFGESPVSFVHGQASVVLQLSFQEVSSSKCTVKCDYLSGQEFTSIPACSGTTVYDIQVMLSAKLHITVWRLRLVLPDGCLLSDIPSETVIVEIANQDEESAEKEQSQQMSCDAGVLDK